MAYSTASGGAMGEPGGAKMLMEDGTLYHFNYFTNDISPDDIQPLLDSAFEDRGVAYLGFGNYLFFHAVDEDWLFERTNRYMESSDEFFAKSVKTPLYIKWVDFFREHLLKDVL